MCVCGGGGGCVKECVRAFVHVFVRVDVFVASGERPFGSLRL